jgi:ribonuclease-3
VSTAGLARLAGRLSLGEYLLLGEGESQRGGRHRPALLASAFEAVVGALYLDLGYEAAGVFLVALAAPELTADRPLGALKSPKSRLQEFTQRLSGERPQYRLLDAVGPDHDKIFRVEVAVAGRVVGVGEGHSRRLAEMAAAARAIEALRETPGDLADQTLGAPELVSFGLGQAGSESDEGGEWGVFCEAKDARGEPWVEFDPQSPGRAGPGDGPGERSEGRRGEGTRGDGR